MEMPPFFQWIDPYLIWGYRITGHALADFLLGTLGAAVLALLVGELTSFLASFLVRRRYQEVAGEAKRYQDLSMEALKSGDRPAYEAANQVANEAFNKSFFMQVALSATFFWPVFFILGWMQYRFLEVEFPLPFVGFSLGYIGVFILLYIPVYILYKQTKRRLPHCRRTKGRLDSHAPPGSDVAELRRAEAPGG
ncbi:MAG: hypothetical protein ACHQ2F_10620 [Desulfobaccales bacterium]